jgi:hypothetical protein
VQEQIAITKYLLTSLSSSNPDSSTPSSLSYTMPDVDFFSDTDSLDLLVLEVGVLTKSQDNDMRQYKKREEGKKQNR